MGKTTKIKDKAKVQRTIGSKTEDKTAFFCYAFRNILLVGLPVTIISAFVLPHLSLHSSASSYSSDNISIELPVSCTMSGVGNTHSESLINGTYDNNIGNGVTTLTTYCNDKDGYIIYTIGSSNNKEGNTNLVGDNGSSIVTGIATYGNTSNWAMKLASLDNTLTMNSTFTSDFASIPTFWTEVAKKESGTTDSETGSSITTTYAVYVSNFQPAGTYSGQVKYMLIHPSYGLAVYYMQEVDSWKNTLAMEESAQAIDKRDGKSYWVTKLKDGNVWMTQNLDFDIVADAQDPTKMKTLTSEDTDLTDHSLTGVYSGANGYSYDENTGITTWTPSSTAKTINFEDTTVTDWQNSNVYPYSASKIDDTNTGNASLGNYYNWTAAIASNNSSTSTSSTLNNVSQNPQNSICPKGWRLPTISNESETLAGSTNEFARLNYLYNDNSTSNDQGLISEPLYFMYSGIINAKSSNTLISLGSLGLYMSSTNYGAQGFYGIRFQTNGVAIEQFNNDYGGKKSGFSVRCVAR